MPPPGRFSDLGIEIGELTPDMVRQFGYKDGSGVVITAVQPDTPAALAGLQEGMLIEKFGQQRVNLAREFKEALQNSSLEKGVLLPIRSSRGTQFVVVRKGPV